MKIRADAFNAYGGPQCACCGTLINEFLTIDHIHGGGSKQKLELGGGGIKLYLWLKRNHYPAGFQVLCMNCNFAKGKYGMCPHEPWKEVAVSEARVKAITGKCDLAKL